MEGVATTRAAALRGGAILEKLANISGPREIVETAITLDALLQSIKVLAEPLLPEHVSLEIECDAADRPYALDTGSLTDSLINLILNARDAMDGAPGVITVSAAPKGSQWISIAVQDQGPGFTDEALERGIEPFFSTKNKRDGTGLGLPMVFDFAQISGGQLSIANINSGGGCVTLLLPQKKATRTGRKLLVLLVEDDPDIREATRDHLRDMGHQVIEASSVPEARQLAVVPEINLILSDLHLGEPENGLALAKEPNLPPVLYVTSAAPNDTVRKQAAELRPVLQKPFTREALQSFLIEHIQ